MITTGTAPDEGMISPMSMKSNSLSVMPSMEISGLSSFNSSRGVTDASHRYGFVIELPCDAFPAMTMQCAPHTGTSLTESGLTPHSPFICCVLSVAHSCSAQSVRLILSGGPFATEGRGFFVAVTTSPTVDVSMRTECSVGPTTRATNTAIASIHAADT